MNRDPAVAAATLRQALALWRGPALVEVAGTSAGRAVAARLDELRLTALENRIDADLRRGVTAGLVAELEGLVVEHPTREPLAARLMRALQAAGRRGAALEVYGQIRERLADELGVDPSAELAALHLELLRDEPAVPTAPWAAAGASQTEASPRTNLRAELTSFVGRDDELAQVAGLLGAYRLVTLTGPGGAGKTRLAVEAARAELDAAGGGPLDGVWLVELAPVSDPGEVPSAVLNALGLREQALIPAARPLASWAAAEEQAADTLGRLVSAVAGRRALLVLDNCEHLVAAAAALADRVLATCPQVRILATSREPLNITGEALWAVGPLTLPPDPAATDSTAERAAWHALRNDPAGLSRTTPRSGCSPSGPRPSSAGSRSPGPVPTRKPRMSPTTSSMTRAQACLARSASIRPASGANRAIGSDRSRSKNPFSRSVDSPVAVFSVANRAFCTMMPGRANIRYAFGEPPMAPPKTYVNSSRNISGWMLKSISSAGLCLIWTSVRQASENVCRRPCSGPTRGASATAASMTVISLTALSMTALCLAGLMPRSLPARERSPRLRSGGR